MATPALDAILCGWHRHARWKTRVPEALQAAPSRATT